MPEPGQTPQPAFKRGQSLDYGEATSANALQAILAQPDTNAQPDEYQPQGPEEQFLLSNTDRPNEPITQGAPFGAGSDWSKYQQETNNEFMGRVAGEMVALPTASTEVRLFAERVAKGL